MNNNQNVYKVIGLMSGTSLDGLDIAYCTFQKKEAGWVYHIESTETIPYDTVLKSKLSKATTMSGLELLYFDQHYGTWLGEQVHNFITARSIGVDFIASHGHTIFHQPDKGLTCQIGSGQHLANACNHKVICDFRTNDVLLGGQGAPLVPIGDRLLFSQYDCCLNLGGISNMSFVINDQRIAFDIAPVNMLLNYICKKINLEYDDQGQLASQGTLNQALLQQLNALPYYQQVYPKSLGFEWFEENIIPIIEQYEDSIENLLYTSVEHITFQIKESLVKTQKTLQKILITGGGAKNTFFIKTLEKHLKNKAKVHIPDQTIIDFKEALIFAFMGVLKDRNEINCLASVTGASKNSSSGSIFMPL